MMVGRVKFNSAAARLIAGALCAVALVFAPPAAAKKAQKNSGPFASAQECGKCHSDIFRNWEKSLHALSYRNPIFLAAYYKAYTETQGAAAKYCLACHAPTASPANDLALTLPATLEGVTCDFCHSVAKINMGGEPGHRFTLEPGKAKRSALKNPSRTAHPSEYSADFASAALCAGCHDFKNKNGVHVGATYEEWRASPFAQNGTQCQSCHMPETAGRTANKDGRDVIHDHSLSHTSDTMKKAVSVAAAVVKRSEQALEVEVKITNTGAGHAIPTGTPARGLAIEARIKDAAGGIIARQTHIIRKVVRDGAGNVLTSDGDAFLNGAEIIADKRPLPGQTLTETFTFLADAKKAVAVEAEVYFIYRPLTVQQTEMKIPFAGATARP